MISRSVKYEAASWCSSSRETTELFPEPESDFLFSFCLSRKMVRDSSPRSKARVRVRVRDREQGLGLGSRVRVRVT